MGSLSLNAFDAAAVKIFHRAVPSVADPALAGMLLVLVFDCLKRARDLSGDLRPVQAARLAVA
jgi:hypothetical protein